MNTITTLLTGLLLTATLAACGNESRVETQKDVAAARANAAEETGEASADAAESAAKSSYDLALAQAEGAYKIAIERCEALLGDAQGACKDTAEAELETAKVQAKAARDRQM